MWSLAGAYIRKREDATVTITSAMTEESVGRVLEHNWDDLSPLEQDDGPHPVASIAYTDDYKTMMGYLRRVMEVNELSTRSFDLTTALIDMNPAHYTIWEYRRRVLEHLGTKEDLEWLDEATIEHSKNYQIWHHRQSIRYDNDEAYYKHEYEIAQQVILDDTKHYHAWTHLQWLMKQRLGSVFTLEEELDLVNKLLDLDVYNNSAWNYRYFLLHKELTNKEVLDGEREYVENKIALAPQNEAPWNYLAGIFEKKYPQDLLTVAEKYSDKSIHGMEILARLKGQDDHEAAKSLYSRLEELNPVRKGYWRYMKAGLV
jgi:protein farnesyltransferase/geranylgeranyltransferase type-1 subunit alpha